MSEHVRLMCWCRTCVTGVHLPAFAAAEAGVFADYGLDVEFVDAAVAPAWTLQGFSARPKAVAAGDADFALTAVAYLLAAQSEADGALPARFAATLHQRNPIAAIVPDDSDLEGPADLEGRRAARWSLRWFAQEYAGALDHLGFGPPVVVEMREGADPSAALASGGIDVIPTLMDMTPGHSLPELPVRAIPLDIGVYATGLLAADRLPLELVVRMRDAFVAGFELQREQPELGVTAFRRRFPTISAEHARANWAIFEPYAVGDGSPGSMNADRWDATIQYTAAAHGLPAHPAERVYRPELLSPPEAPARVT